MITTRLTLLAAVALAGALAACSTTATVDPTSTTAVITSTPSATSAPAPTASPSATDTSTPVSEVPPTSEATTSSPVDGFGLSGEDLVNAEAAWNAYLAYRAFLAQAVADPAADWSVQLAELTGDPLIVNTQTSLTRQARLGTQIVDRSTVRITRVTSNDGGFTFDMCLDITGNMIVDKNGNDAKAPDAPGSYYRHPGSVTVDSQSGKWVSVIVENDFQVQC